MVCLLTMWVILWPFHDWPQVYGSVRHISPAGISNLMSLTPALVALDNQKSDIRSGWVHLTLPTVFKN